MRGWWEVDEGGRNLEIANSTQLGQGRGGTKMKEQKQRAAVYM